MAPSMMPAIWWNLAGWMMWGIFIASLRYVAEYREQLAETQAGLSALETEPAAMAGEVRR
jgi:heme exporter protein C